MPSTSSWFSRHFAPPPPINNAPMCPCASCYNTSGSSSSASPHAASPYTYSYTVAESSKPSISRAPTVIDSDGASISSADTATTTTHVEYVAKQ